MYEMNDFQGKSPHDLLDYLKEKCLKEDMPQLSTLACVAVIIPVSTASVERSFSALKQIKTYSRNAIGQTRLSALASMSIEKDLLLELKCKDRLYDRVMEVFLRKERKMDFVLKRFWYSAP